MSKKFGTDGIRGIANEDLTATLVFAYAKAFAIYWLESEPQMSKKIVIGRDTRISGDMLSSAICAGLTSMGFEVVLGGIMPTPALAYSARTLGIPGIMITASHNPANHNGVKFYDNFGNKISLEIQASIEEIFEQRDSYINADSNCVGIIKQDDSLTKKWIDYTINKLGNPDFTNFKVALDCANGAGYHTNPYAFKLLGANVQVFNAQNDGQLINKDCGSMHTEHFTELVKANGCDIGFTFDGDSDRVLAVDENGIIYDGTDMMYIFANYLHDTGQLKDDVMVTTIVTNCGLENSLAPKGIKTISTGVGGIHIQKVMLENGYTFGAEENGHLMLGDFNSESDGLTVALYLLKILQEKNLKLYELLDGLVRCEAVKCDIAVTERQKQAVRDGKLLTVISELESCIADKGRIVVRVSGTEQVVRVMVEGENSEQLHSFAEILNKAIQEC